MARLFQICQQSVWSTRKVKSQATVKSNIKILCEFIGDELVADMNYTKLELLVQRLFDEGYAAGTVHRKMCAISKALNHAARLTDDNGKPILAGKIPMPTVIANNTRDRVLTKTEEANIFLAIANRIEAEPNRNWYRYGLLIKFLLDTACRLGEALNVSLPHISERDGVTFVNLPRYSTKNNRPRLIPADPLDRRNHQNDALFENLCRGRTYLSASAWNRMVYVELNSGRREATWNAD
jgi:integrase